MPNSPLVSVIIPTYNRLPKLQKALESALNQGEVSLEVIIADDGSADGTRDFFQNFSNPNVQYFYKDNEGLPALTRNFGASKAKGKYLAFLDSDDKWFPKKLKTQIEIMENNSNISFSYTQAVAKVGDRLVNVSGAFFKKSGNIFIPLLFRNFVVTSSVVVKKEIFDKVGGFPVDEELLIAEDLKLWLKLSRLGHGYYVDLPLVEYELEDQGVSKDFIRKFDCLLIVLKWAMSEQAVSNFMKYFVFNFLWLRIYRQGKNSLSLLSHFYGKAIEDGASRLILILYKMRIWKLEKSK